MTARAAPATARSSATANSAYEPPPRSGRWNCPNTASPTDRRRTPVPTATTSPAPSEPSTSGKECRTVSLRRPSAIFQSMGLTPAADSRTRTSPGPGSGSGSSMS
ncbi:hypothetical protein SRIMM317S_06358 [Streptomyces rimosus subsp. rimosus]